MPTIIHPNAHVDSTTQLGENVSVGSGAVIEGDAQIGDGCQIGSNAFVGEHTTLGRECRLFHGAVVGSIAQDLKYQGEDVVCVVGDRTVFREYCTINRGTSASGETVIGNDCAFLAYCHVGHDSYIGNNVVASNTLNIAGHVTVGNNVWFGGVVAVHQFCHVGDHAYLGAYSKVVKDVLPFALVGGGVETLKISGINKVGLERRGYDEPRRRKILNAYKELFLRKKNLSEAVELLEQSHPADDDIGLLTAFIKKSQRGIYRM